MVKEGLESPPTLDSIGYAPNTKVRVDFWSLRNGLQRKVTGFLSLQTRMALGKRIKGKKIFFVR